MCTGCYTATAKGYVATETGCPVLVVEVPASSFVGAAFVVAVVGDVAAAFASVVVAAAVAAVIFVVEEVVVSSRVEIQTAEDRICCESSQKYIIG